MATDLLKDETFKRHADELLAQSQSTPFLVFLCGPKIELATLPPEHPDYSPAAVLRKRLKDNLEQQGFSVVLGEDEGLEDARIRVDGLDAQHSELAYISKYCDAVIIVSGSVGSFCELGLFSWHYAQSKVGWLSKNPRKDFILLVEKKFESDKSYFNVGPAQVITHFGMTCFIDYETFDAGKIIERLKSRRVYTSKDRRGRRPQSRKPAP